MKQEIKTNPLMYVNRYIEFLQHKGKLSAVDVLAERERRKMTLRVYTPQNLIVFSLYDKWNGVTFEIHLLRQMRAQLNQILPSSATLAKTSLTCEEIVFPFSRAGNKKFDNPFIYPNPNNSTWQFIQNEFGITKDEVMSHLPKPKF